MDIPAKLEKWKTAEEEKGNLVKAREHDQAWNAIIDILDQFVEILGDEKVTLKAFSNIGSRIRITYNFHLFRQQWTKY